MRVTDGDWPALYTVGHSTHSFDNLLRLLKQHGVTAVADVRSHPYSARLGHFNREEFSAALEAAGIKYVFLGKELGARRDERESYSGDRAAYERIALLPGFREGLERLRRGAREYQVALLCAEKEPLDCHRTVLVCRELRGEFDIRHILADGSLESHADTERRLVQETGGSVQPTSCPTSRRTHRSFMAPKTECRPTCSICCPMSSGSRCNW